MAPPLLSPCLPIPFGIHLYTRRAISCQPLWLCLRAFFSFFFFFFFWSGDRAWPTHSAGRAGLSKVFNYARLDSMHKYSSFLAIQVGQLWDMFHRLSGKVVEDLEMDKRDNWMCFQRTARCGLVTLEALSTRLCYFNCLWPDNSICLPSREYAKFSFELQMSYLDNSLNNW